MKVNVAQLKTAGISTGMAIAGFTAGHVANSFAPQKVQKFVPYGEIVAGVAIAAIAKQGAVQSFGVGLAAHGALKTVNNLTAPSMDAEGNTVAATGIKAMISNYVPRLSGVDSYGMGCAYGYGMGFADELVYEETPMLMGLEEEAPQTEEWM